MTPDTELVIWGRRRAGRRWFWAARWVDQDDVPHVLCGHENTELAALASGQRGAREITDGRPATLLRRHGVAADVLAAYNAEQRAARPPAAGQAAAAVEYLYAVVDTSWDDHRAEPFVVSHTIVRKTERRIYFVAQAAGTSTRTGFVDRQVLEAAGEVYYRAGRTTLYAVPPTLGAAAPAPVDLAALKQQMAAAHPDVGGTDAEFIAARTAYQSARARQ